MKLPKAHVYSSLFFLLKIQTFQVCIEPDKHCLLIKKLKKSWRKKTEEKGKIIESSAEITEVRTTDYFEPQRRMDHCTDCDPCVCTVHGTKHRNYSTRQKQITQSLYSASSSLRKSLTTELPLAETGFHCFLRRPCPTPFSHPVYFLFLTRREKPLQICLLWRSFDSKSSNGCGLRHGAACN